VPTLEGKTIFVSGASRGIGLAIALRAARDGANVALIAKTNEPHPKLEGTVHTAAEAIEEAGGQALPIVGDIRDDGQVECTGNFFLCEDVPAEEGVTDLSRYSFGGADSELQTDLFVEG